MPRSIERRVIGPRYVNELLSRLDRVISTGHVEIRRSELLRWYGLERFRPTTIWRDISERWEQFGYGVPLLVGDVDGVYVFVWGEGLTTSETSWLKAVSELSSNGEEEFEAA